MRNRSMGIVGMATMGAALMSVIASPRGMHVAGPPPEAKSRRVVARDEPGGGTGTVEAESRQVRRARERHASKLFK
jgi:hypothetical protein